MNHAKLLALIVSAFCFTANVQASPIFTATFDAQDIFDDGLFSDRVASLSGSSVAFGASQSGMKNAGFLHLNLIDAGVLSSTGQYQVNITVTEDRSLGGIDQDVFYAISESGAGSRDFIGIQHADNGGGQLRQFAGSYDTFGAVDVLTGATGGATQFPGAFETWSATILVGTVDSIAVTSPIAMGAFGSASFDIDPSLGLSFSGFLDDFYETTGIESVSVSVLDLNAASIPEPVPTVLLSFGILGLVLRKSVVKSSNIS